MRPLAVRVATLLLRPQKPRLFYQYHAPWSRKVAPTLYVRGASYHEVQVGPLVGYVMRRGVAHANHPFGKPRKLILNRDPHWMRRGPRKAWRQAAVLYRGRA